MELQAINNPIFTFADFFNLSIYRRLALILFGGMGIAALSTLLLWRGAPSPNNPFSAYGDILPGQPKQMVENHGFNCVKNTNYYSSDFATCTLTPVNSKFTQIEVLATQDVIVQSTFFVPDDSFKFGDLMMGMNISDFRTYPHELFFFWQKIFVSVKTSLKRHAIALRPVASITFTDVSYQGKITTFSQ